MPHGRRLQVPGPGPCHFALFGLSIHPDLAPGPARTRKHLAREEYLPAPWAHRGGGSVPSSVSQKPLRIALRAALSGCGL